MAPTIHYGTDSCLYAFIQAPPHSSHCGELQALLAALNAPMAARWTMAVTLAPGHVKAIPMAGAALNGM
jgi:hypothetical protein